MSPCPTLVQPNLLARLQMKANSPLPSVTWVRLAEACYLNWEILLFFTETAQEGRLISRSCNTQQRARDAQLDVDCCAQAVCRAQACRNPLALKPQNWQWEQQQGISLHARFAQGSWKPFCSDTSNYQDTSYPFSCKQTPNTRWSEYLTVGSSVSFPFTISTNLALPVLVSIHHYPGSVLSLSYFTSGCNCNSTHQNQ